MSPWWTRTAVKRKRYSEVLEWGEKKVKLLYEVKWNRYIPHKACMRVSTCSHKWGWAVSSVLVSVERWRETFHWTVAYCCYSVLNLKKKLKFILKHWKKKKTLQLVYILEIIIIIKLIIIYITFTFNHLADAFIQSDVQMRRTIEAIRPSREQQYTSALTSLS